MNAKIYAGDSIRLMITELVTAPTPVPYGTKLKGVYFDGYPQLVKQRGSQPTYEVKTEKDIMVRMRDGVRIAVDVHRPKVADDRFPAILAWGMWGKDLQEAVRWLADKPQPYIDSPFWDGTMEAGNFMYTVPRGYAHVIPDPRGVGNSEGGEERTDVDIGLLHKKEDIYDLIEWIAAQPWCNGNVGMMGPSSYAEAQMAVGADPPPHLKALHPDECPAGTGDHFHGIFDTMPYHIMYGRHGNDSVFPVPNYPYKVKRPELLDLPKEELQARLEEALNHPDIKYNSKWYSYIKYPLKSGFTFNSLLNSFHPRPGQPALGVLPDIDKIKLPIYLGAPWGIRLYMFGAFEAYEHVSTPARNKKLIVYPPGYPPRPYTWYHDEIVRWYDYWLKGIDTGIMEEPPIKMFVMGVNKWRFESEWPLERTNWAKLYLHPGGRLSTDSVSGKPEPDRFTQVAPYKDPAVCCLSYRTPPLIDDTEITGPVALYLDAAIDKEDTNWMIDLVMVDPDGNRQLISQGHLKAAHRALDQSKSKAYDPIHPRQDPVPVPPGKVIQYGISLLPTACVFKRGYALELIIRNQDDVLSRLGTWGIYMLPFMQTVTHEIHFGDSHLLVPHIPAGQEHGLKI
jgi:predicted acyl esterase